MTKNDVETLRNAYNKHGEQLALAERDAAAAARRVLMLSGARSAVWQLLTEAEKVCETSSS